MQSPLQQNLITAKSDSLLNFGVEFVLAENVHILMLGMAIEGAEIANGGTGVRVVDVAIDIVRAIRLGMEASRHLIGGMADCHKVVRLQQRETFLG